MRKGILVFLTLIVLILSACAVQQQESMPQPGGGQVEPAARHRAVILEGVSRGRVDSGVRPTEHVTGRRLEGAGGVPARVGHAQEIARRLISGGWLGVEVECRRIRATSRVEAGEPADGTGLAAAQIEKLRICQ